MKKLILIAFLTILVTSCAPDPRREADAYETRQLADMQVANSAQARAQAQALADMDIANRKATQAELQSGINRVIRFASFFVSLAVAVSITGAGVGTGWALVGAGKASMRVFELRANLIPLDRVTRQYPLLVQYISKGRFSLTNPNTGSVVLLDTRNEPDRAMIAGMSQTQYVGSLAHESRLSIKPGEVSRIQAPEIIEINQ